MGRVNDTIQRKFPNNNRVHPAGISSYICYYCGNIVSDRVEYQLHMLKVHEVMSQSYQLWSDQTMDSLGLRWSETKGHDDRENSCSLPASPIAHESKQKRSDDDDEDYVYEEEKPARKRKKGDDEKTRARQKQRRAERKREVDELLKVDDNRFDMVPNDLDTNHQERRRMSTVEPKGDVREELGKRKRRRTEGGSRRRDVEDERDVPDISELVSRIMVESKKKEASSNDVVVEEMTAPEIKERRPYDYSDRCLKYCKVCKKGMHYTFASLFEHYQDHHHAVFQSLHYYGFRGKRLIGKKNLLQRAYCSRCIIPFTRERDYFTHMIQFHINESVRCQLGFEIADNADVEARMLFRERIITLGYNFKFEEGSPDCTPYNDRPATSASGEPFSADHSLDNLSFEMYQDDQHPCSSSSLPGNVKIEPIEEKPIVIRAKSEPIDFN